MENEKYIEKDAVPSIPSTSKSSDDSKAKRVNGTIRKIGNNNAEEKDAVPCNNTVTELVRSDSNNSELVEANENIATLNNNMVLRQSSSTVNYEINNSSGFTIGSVFKFGLPASATAPLTVATIPAEKSDEHVYKKTPTIKQMMESKDPLLSSFLDNIAGHFGARWREITILLGIDQYYVDRMHEDYFQKGGTQEVKLEFN